MLIDAIKCPEIRCNEGARDCGHVETVCLLSNRKPDTKVRIDVDLEDYYRIKESSGFLRAGFRGP